MLAGKAGSQSIQSMAFPALPFMLLALTVRSSFLSAPRYYKQYSSSTQSKLRPEVSARAPLKTRDNVVYRPRRLGALLLLLTLAMLLR